MAGWVTDGQGGKSGREILNDPRCKTPPFEVVLAARRKGLTWKQIGRKFHMNPEVCRMTTNRRAKIRGMTYRDLLPAESVQRLRSEGWKAKHSVKPDLIKAWLLEHVEISEKRGPHPRTKMTVQQFATLTKFLDPENKGVAVTTVYDLVKRRKGRTHTGIKKTTAAKMIVALEELDRRTGIDYSSEDIAS